MSTSLSRQLAQLQTSGVTQKPQSYASSGPSLLDVEITPDQVRILAKEGFQKLVQSCPVVAKFKTLVFGQDDVDQDDDEDDMDVDQNLKLEDFLVILSSQLLSKESQFLLQYLVHHQKIHLGLDEWLLFVSIPYFKFKIFNNIVKCFPNKLKPDHAHPNWINHFRTACHPATEVGLYRHLASDRGFFDILADHFVRLARHHVPTYGSEIGMNYDHILKFFLSTMIGALNLCHNIGEHQTRHLIRAISAAYKSGHPEFRATASVLMAMLVPRVILNKKSAGKLVQVLKKASGKKRDEETLGTLAILYRCQRESVDVSVIAEQFLDHRDTLLAATSNPGQMDEDDQDFARKLVKTLALLMEDCTKDVEDPNEQTCSIIQLVFDVLEADSEPNLDTAEILVSTSTTNMVKWKSVKKALGKNNQDSENVKKAIKLSKKVANLLRASHPDAYVRKSVLKPEHDILFMEGEEGMPTQDEIEVKQLLMNDVFVREMSKEIIDLKVGRVFPKISRSELVSENAANLVKIFGSVSPGFLLRQIETEKLCYLLANVLSLFDCNEKVIAKVFSFINHREFVQFEPVHQQFKDLQLHLSGLILKNLIVPHKFNFKTLTSGTASYLEAYQQKDDPVVSLMQSLKVTFKVAEKEDDNMAFNTIILDKMFSSVSPKSALSLVTLWRENEAIQRADLASIIVALLVSALKKPGQEWENLAVNFIQFLRDISKDYDLEELENLEEKGDNQLALYVGISRFSKRISLQLFNLGLDALKGLPYADVEDLRPLKLDLMAVAATLEAKGMASTSARSLIEKDLSLNTVEKLEEFLLETVLEPKEIFDGEECGEMATKKTLSFRVKQYCLLKYAKMLSGSPDALKRLLSLTSNTFCLMLVIAVSQNPKKIRKLISGCLEAALETKTQMASAQSFRKLAQHLLDNKSAVLNSPDNMKDIMETFIESDKKGSTMGAVLNLVLRAESLKYVEHLVMYVKDVNGKSEMIAASKFGAKVLEMAEDNDEALQALLPFLKTFTPNILDHAFKEPACWNFIERCLKSQLKTLDGDDFVAAVTLELVKQNITKIDFQDGAAIDTLFTAVMDLSKDCKESQILLGGRHVIDSMPAIPSALFVNKLVDIWGQDVAEAGQGRGGRISRRQAPALQGSDDTWRQTFYLLETFLIIKGSPETDFLKPLTNLLKSALANEDGYNNSYALELILSSIQKIIDGLDMDQLQRLDEKMISPELIVQCIRSCKNPDAKATALLILAKASASNAEYVLHNSIPIFTFMGTHFLKIEARSSFDVACQAIDIIIPHIKKVCLAKGDGHETCVSIIKTFVDAASDMAPHRLTTFMNKLIQKLDEKEFLWVFALLYIRADSKRRVYTGQGNDIKAISLSMTEKHQHLFDLFYTFDQTVQINALQTLLEKMRTDSKELRALLEIGQDDQVMEVEGAKKLAPKEQLDLARVKVLHFVTCLVASPAFVRDLGKTLMDVNGDKKARKSLHKQLKSLMEISIMNIEHFEKNESRSPRLQRQFASFSEKILEKNLSLLPASVFVKVLTDLLCNHHAVIRRKSLEVLTIKFQRSDDPVLSDKAVMDLLPPLECLSKGKVPESHADETPNNQQLALLSLRSFTRALGSSQPDAFKAACVGLSKKSFLKELDNASVMAAALLCLTDMFQAIGPHAVVCLQPFAQWVLDLMGQERIIQDNPVVLSSIIYTVKTCMENFGGFLNPFYGRLVTATCRLSWMQSQQDADDDSAEAKRKWRKGSERIRHLHTAISKGIPTHALLAIVSECHHQVARDSHHCVIALSNILRDNVANLDKNAALSISTPFMGYFMEAFRYRQMAAGTPEEIAHVEDELIQTFLTLVLKLSLDDFKPMFYRLFGLTVEDEDNVEATTTVFRVTSELAKKLKSLFGFISESLIHKANGFLNRFAANEFQALQKDAKLCSRVVLLVGGILSALTSIFTYNRVESLQIKNYEEHVNAILNYFECPAEESDFESLLEQIKECLGQLAASTDDETPWKYLNYQVLLYIRNQSLKVSIFGLPYQNIRSSLMF